MLLLPLNLICHHSPPPSSLIRRASSASVGADVREMASLASKGEALRPSRLRTMRVREYLRTYSGASRGPHSRLGRTEVRELASLSCLRERGFAPLSLA
jgi:hypothetical protein